MCAVAGSRFAAIFPLLEANCADSMSIAEVKMKHDLARIGENKHAFRKQLAARPVAEKLRMLDALRERTLAIRSASKKAVGPQAPATTAKR